VQSQETPPTNQFDSPVAERISPETLLRITKALDKAMPLAKSVPKAKQPLNYGYWEGA
jgi:hypothetical protein